MREALVAGVMLRAGCPRLGAQPLQTANAKVLKAVGGRAGAAQREWGACSLPSVDSRPAAGFRGWTWSSIACNLAATSGHSILPTGPRFSGADAEAAAPASKAVIYRGQTRRLVRSVMVWLRSGERKKAGWSGE